MGFANFQDLWAANTNGSVNFFELWAPHINGSANFNELWDANVIQFTNLQNINGSVNFLGCKY